LVEGSSNNGLSIKVVVADRPYPLKVQNSNEEELVRKAAKLVNEKINELGKNYEADKLDLLAMSSLMLATENLKNEKSVVLEGTEFDKKLSEIDVLLDSFSDDALPDGNHQNNS